VFLLLLLRGPSAIAIENAHFEFPAIVDEKEKLRG